VRNVTRQRAKKLTAMPVGVRVVERVRKSVNTRNFTLERRRIVRQSDDQPADDRPIRQVWKRRVEGVQQIGVAQNAIPDASVTARSLPGQPSLRARSRQRAPSFTSITTASPRLIGSREKAAADKLKQAQELMKARTTPTGMGRQSRCSKSMSARKPSDRRHRKQMGDNGDDTCGGSGIFISISTTADSSLAISRVVWS
jgi:hypothetical protein